MNVPFVDLKADYFSIKEEIDSAIQNITENSSFILGENMEKFEREFSDYCNSKYAVGVNSGTSALHLALIACGIKQGDEVITVPNTFFATVGAILNAGAKPVFVDIDERTHTISVDKIKEKITSKTKAIIPVHLYGQSADMNEVIEIANENNIKIIEDACQAHGAEYKGKKVPVTDVGCFSFYPSKNLGSFGDGGAVVTNDKDVSDSIKLLRAHGESPKNVHSVVGFNCRLHTLQAAILRVKLKYLDDWNKNRIKAAKIYDDLLKNAKDIGAVQKKDYNKHVYHLYVVKTKKRDELKNYLETNGVGVGIHYPKSVHLQKALSIFGYKEGDFPVSEKCSNEILSLPMFPNISEEQVRYVVDKINSFSK